MDIIKKTAEEIIALYEGIGASEKKMNQLTFVLEETPLEGTIISFDESAREYNGNKYFVFNVLRPDGTKGVMSVSRLNDTHVMQGDVQIVKNEKSANAGKIMLKSHRVSGDMIRNIGKSEAERIANMIGKNYKAERITGHVIAKYDDDVLFIKPAKAEKPSKDELTKLWSNTAVSERLFKFIELT